MEQLAALRAAACCRADHCVGDCAAIARLRRLKAKWVLEQFFQSGVWLERFGRALRRRQVGLRIKFLGSLYVLEGE